MFSIPNYYRRNANQNNYKKSNYTSQNDHPHKSTNSKWGRGPRGEGNPPPYTVDREVSWEGTLSIATRKDSLDMPKKIFQGKYS